MVASVTAGVASLRGILSEWARSRFGMWGPKWASLNFFSRRRRRPQKKDRVRLDPMDINRNFRQFSICAFGFGTPWGAQNHYRRN